jgi:hypothetical protein
MSWKGRYLCRLLTRVPVRSLLSLVLAALLAFAFGVLTVLRGIYGEAYRNVDVRGVFYGGLPYTAAQKLEKSGLVRDPGYEYINRDCEIEYHGGTLYFVSGILRFAQGEVEWLEGWDEAAFDSSDEQVCVMSAGSALMMGFSLGDPVRVEEAGYTSALARELDKWQTDEDWNETLVVRDQRRPRMRLVGLIQSDEYDNTLYIPVTAWKHFYWISNQLTLDLAEYSLTDYHRAEEFREYAKEVLSHVQNIVKLELDTSYADRLYNIYRLIETLYPLTIGAALLLGGILPGLTVLHVSREISILRALGVKIGACAGLYVMAQILCAFVGLALGFLTALLIQHPDPETVVRPFGLYIAAHLAACAAGSGIFAWLCARKHVLAQLQSKE